MFYLDLLWAEVTVHIGHDLCPLSPLVFLASRGHTTHDSWVIDQNEIQGALSLEINEQYFKNNIADDGSYNFDGTKGVYTKTITADNLDFSIDADGE